MLNTSETAVVEKIKKLLALRESPNEAEASLAMEMAHKMLSEHNLSLSDIDMKKHSVSEQQYHFLGKQEEWAILLLNQIAYVNYSTIYVAEYDDENHIQLVGREHNIAALKVMADYILTTIDRMAIPFENRGKEDGASYKIGFSTSLCERLAKLRKEEIFNSDSRELVVSEKKEIQDYMNDLYGDDMDQKKAKEKIENLGAFMAGKEDGKKLSLNDQIKEEA